MSNKSIIISNLPSDSQFDIELYDEEDEQVDTSGSILPGEYTLKVIDIGSPPKYKVSTKPINIQSQVSTISPYTTDMNFIYDNNSESVEWTNDYICYEDKIPDVEYIFKNISKIGTEPPGIEIPYRNNITRKTDISYVDQYIKNDDGDNIIYVPGSSNDAITVIGKIILDENNIFTSTLEYTRDKSVKNRIEYIDLKYRFKAIIITKVENRKVHFVGVDNNNILGFYTISTTLDDNTIELIKGNISSDNLSSNTNATVKNFFDKVLDTSKYNIRHKYFGKNIHVLDDKIVATAGKDDESTNIFYKYMYMIDLKNHIFRYIELPYQLITCNFTGFQHNFISKDCTKMIGFGVFDNNSSNMYKDFVIFDISNIDNIKYKIIPISSYVNDVNMMSAIGFIGNNIVLECKLQKSHEYDDIRILILDKDTLNVIKKYTCKEFSYISNINNVYSKPSIRGSQYNYGSNKYYGRLYRSPSYPCLLYMSDDTMTNIDTVGYDAAITPTNNDTIHYSYYFNKKFILINKLLHARTEHDKMYLEYNIEVNVVNNKNITIYRGLESSADIYILDDGNKVEYPITGLYPADKPIHIDISIPGYEITNKIDTPNHKLYDFTKNKVRKYRNYLYGSVYKSKVEIKEDIKLEADAKVAKFRF